MCFLFQGGGAYLSDAALEDFLERELPDFCVLFCHHVQ